MTLHFSLHNSSLARHVLVFVSCRRRCQVWCCCGKLWPQHWQRLTWQWWLSCLLTECCNTTKLHNITTRQSTILHKSSTEMRNVMNCEKIIWNYDFELLKVGLAELFWHMLYGIVLLVVISDIYLIVSQNQLHLLHIRQDNGTMECQIYEGSWW